MIRSSTRCLVVGCLCAALAKTLLAADTPIPAQRDGQSPQELIDKVSQEMQQFVDQKGQEKGKTPAGNEVGFDPFEKRSKKLGELKKKLEALQGAGEGGPSSTSLAPPGTAENLHNVGQADERRVPTGYRARVTNLKRGLARVPLWHS
jgi:hypothetical protein